MPDLNLAKQWVRCEMDRIAIEEGYYFNAEKAQHICDFFEEELVLYEGEYAGRPFRLMDWQREYLSRAFGWVKWSEEWGREIRRFRKCSIWIPKKNGVLAPRS